MLDHRTDTDDEPVRPLRARHRRGIKRHEGERVPKPTALPVPIGYELFRYAPLPLGAHRRALRRLAGGGCSRGNVIRPRLLRQSSNRLPLDATNVKTS